ncbi:MAG: hypothetical protein LLF89_00005 [Spirochaetaceae bacterium]|nr:hypothetical protein [Spirochaetaceae bacterium]
MRLIRFANAQPGYPNNTFSFVLEKFMREELKLGEHKLTMDAIGTKDEKMIWGNAFGSTQNALSHNLCI